MDIPIYGTQIKIGYALCGGRNFSPKEWWKDDDIRYAERERERAVEESVNHASISLEELFNELAEKWKRETSGYTSVATMILHPAYLEIISHGDKMIPYILKDLQKKPSHWFIALKTLAKTSPVKPEDAGNIKKMTEAWIAWGIENGKLI